jgi:hypothetical protein
MLLPQHGRCRKPGHIHGFPQITVVSAAKRQLVLCWQSRHIKIAYWICKTGRQGVKGHVRTVSKHMRTGAVDIQLPQWEHHGGSQKLSLRLHPRRRLNMKTYWTGMWLSSTAILKLRWAVHNWAKVHEYFKSRGATSKFWVPEGWHKASSILRAHNTGVTYEPHCYPPLFCSIHVKWYIFLYVNKKCCNWAENNRHHRTKFGHPGFAHPSPGVS